MGRRKRSFCIGLLIFFTLLLPADEGDIPEVRIETFPANPTVNNPWLVYVLVRHPSPLEVDVRPPPFPPFLVLERTRSETRLIDGDERWTRVEFRFAPLRADEITLEPFEVRTPAGLASTDRINVRFAVETVRRRFEPRLRWLTPVSPVAPGEAAELFLELTNWNPNRRIPEGLFWGRAPLNAIVSEGFPELVTEGVYRYPISVIPLDESNITLAAFSIAYDAYLLNIPRIDLVVLPSRFVFEENILPDENRLDENSARIIPFPETRERVFFLFQGEYDRITARARALWDENRRAESLAELRRNERDSFSGLYLGSLRREIEQTLGLGFTESERWRPFGIPLAVYAFFLIAIISALLFFFVLRPRLLSQGKNMLLLRRNSFLSVVVLIAAAGLVIIVLEGSLGDFPATRSSGTAAVLKSTYSYRIPDFRGATNDWFNEGQPVIVGGHSGNWRLAETPDGRSGWVPLEMVIVY